MKTVDLVSLQTFSGEFVRRRVVEIAGKTVYICTEQEWEDAMGEGREPECAGFVLEYVRPFRQ